MVSAIGPVGGYGSVNVDFYIEQVRKSYRFKKEIAYFNEHIQECPTIYPDGTIGYINKNNNDNSESNNNELLKSSGADDIQNELSFEKSKQNNVDNDDNDLFTKLVDLINQKENQNTDEEFNIDVKNDELPKSLNDRKFGPPFGLKIENFDYVEYFK